MRSGWYEFSKGPHHFFVRLRRKRGKIRFTNAPDVICRAAMQAYTNCEWQWRFIEVPDGFPVESSA